MPLTFKPFFVPYNQVKMIFKSAISAMMALFICLSRLYLYVTLAEHSRTSRVKLYAFRSRFRVRLNNKKILNRNVHKFPSPYGRGLG